MFSSTKLNGSRLLMRGTKLLSKSGLEETCRIPHLNQAMDMLRGWGFPNLDMEVYRHGMPLQRIRSAWLKPVKSVSDLKKLQRLNGGPLDYDPNEDASRLSLCVFDIAEEGLTPEERQHQLGELRKKLIEMYVPGLTICQMYPTMLHSERLNLLEQVVREGYEGLVHYFPDDAYEFGVTSSTAFKHKPRLDAEAFCFDVLEAKNGNGTLCLRTPEGKEFKAVMTGNKEFRAYENQLQFIGQWINYEYEELSAAGVPTKPVATGPRKCDGAGNPLQ